MYLIPEYFMQEMILILSRCQTKRLSPKTKKSYYRFHFKGFYNGNKIKQIHLFTNENTEIIKGEDYLLWVGLKGVFEANLEVFLIKYKKIE